MKEDETNLDKMHPNHSEDAVPQERVQIDLNEKDFQDKFWEITKENMILRKHINALITDAEKLKKSRNDK